MANLKQVIRRARELDVAAQSLRELQQKRDELAARVAQLDLEITAKQAAIATALDQLKTQVNA